MRIQQQKLRRLIREAVVNLGGKNYQIPKSKYEELVSLMSNLGIEEFDPLKEPTKSGFAEEKHWQNWTKSVEGIIPDEKLQRLYFLLYGTGAGASNTMYLDNVLDRIYDADPVALNTALFSVDSAGSQVEVPQVLKPIAEIDTVAGGGSKADEIGKGELVVPLLFKDAQGAFGNALYDVTVNGQNWHLKGIAGINSSVRSSKLLGPIGKAVTDAIGTSKGELGAGRLRDNYKQVAEIMDLPDDSTPSEVLNAFQEKINSEYREQLTNEAGVVFYISKTSTLYFRKPDEVIVNNITANQPSIAMGVDSPGAYANLASKLSEAVIRGLIKEELTRTDKNQIERIAKIQAKKYFDSQISKALDDEIGKSFFGTRGKINKHVDDSITKRFKNAGGDKDFDEAVIKVAKRVLKAMHVLHFQRKNLIDDMSIPKR